MSPSKIIESNGTEGVATLGRQHYKIASIPADGIGPEVISAGVTVLKKLVEELGTFDLEFEHFDWSSDYYKQHGKYLPDNALEVVKKFDAILFGAVGAPGMSFFFQLSWTFYP
jgi:isocitrate/isopropylmalate dehydrogenase